ncbi:MAG TPA: beta-ketoacyl-ACP synthase 3 [Casimicrobiaceae bacterium]|nr:beta-ketoacyl-ACP synthase 3 [Casimicrobiaceae bacterium]
MTRRRRAEIVGWGKCLPPAVLTNADLTQVIETSDEWIRARTGIVERRISHVGIGELASLAVKRALAAADLPPEAVQLLILGCCTGDDQVPNTASLVAHRCGLRNAAAMDVNTACTSAMYAMSTATALIETSAIDVAVVIGADVLSTYMDWDNRAPVVLFGDGAGALVLRSTEEDVGVLAHTLGADADGRNAIQIRGLGASYANAGTLLGTTEWNFDGPEIFRHAVQSMAAVSKRVLDIARLTIDDVDLFVPHQANLRIIEAVARKLDVPAQRVFTNVQRVGNTSSGAIPIAIAEALEERRIAQGDNVLLASFGSGYTWTGHVIRWGKRTTPHHRCDDELPASDLSALDIVRWLQSAKARKSTPSAATFAKVHEIKARFDSETEALQSS